MEGGPGETKEVQKIILGTYLGIRSLSGFTEMMFFQEILIDESILLSVFSV